MLFTWIIETIEMMLDAWHWLHDETYAGGILSIKMPTSGYDDNEGRFYSKFLHSRSFERNGARFSAPGSDIKRSDKLELTYDKTVKGHVLTENTVFEFVFTCWFIIFLGFLKYAESHGGYGINLRHIRSIDFAYIVLKGFVSFVGAMCAAVVLESDREKVAVPKDVMIFSSTQGRWRTPAAFLYASIGPAVFYIIVNALKLSVIVPYMKIFLISWFIGGFLDLLCNSFTSYGVMWLYPFFKKPLSLPLKIKSYDQENIFKMCVLWFGVAAQVFISAAMFV